MWNITFCCRGTKVGKDGLAPVEMVITVDGVRSYRRLSIKVNPLEYKKLITNKRDNYVKKYCKNERLKAYDTITKLEMSGTPITIETVKDALQNGVKTNYSSEDLQREFLNISKQRIGSDLSIPCYQRYVRISNKVITILGNKVCRSITNKDIRLVAAELRGESSSIKFCKPVVNSKTIHQFRCDKWQDCVQ